MSAIKRISLFSMLLVFLLANIGMGVYTHKCKINGIETSYFVQADDSCETHEHKAEPVAHACCAKKSQLSESGCCSTDKNYILLDLDLSSSVSQATLILSPAIIVLQPSFVLTDIAVTESFSSVSFIHPPPKNQGRDYQSLFQVYTI